MKKKPRDFGNGGGGAGSPTKPFGPTAKISAFNLALKLSEEKNHVTFKTG